MVTLSNLDLAIAAILVLVLALLSARLQAGVSRQLLIAAARTAGSSLVNERPSSPHAWPVPMAGTTRRLSDTTRSSWPAFTSFGSRTASSTPS